jgi:hypothetical protein
VPRTSSIRAQPPHPSAEQLWAISKGERSVTAELREYGRGCEVRLFSDGRCFAAHALASREVAVRYASVIHTDLIARGWVKSTGQAP